MHCQRSLNQCRDLDDVGAAHIGVVPLNKQPYGQLSDRFTEGVIFLTYSSLTSSSDKVPYLRSSTLRLSHAANFANKLLISPDF